MPITELLNAIAMATRNVVSTSHQVDLVEQLVASTQNRNESEIPRDGLLSSESRGAEEKARLKALRCAARAGIADIEAGRFRIFESAEAMRGHLISIAVKGSGLRRT